ncbi:DUF5317 domain-containing protein [Tissierella sp. Yu-01]|uniref:DUF5317 domain-containing protein n=1 Tax=Tissierella sp. Yu-01 TaxID=3035694 RepID=UPI00240E060C|nr:DUF5317 domain-containing protein [Tissierella sp. Yu-01]WFA07951.1 DUF5317 domain-containing protein [Tissierella sp. Yu-01]
MFIEPTVLSILIGKLRGGYFRNIENVQIKGWYLLIVAALIQVLLSLFKVSEYLLLFISITYMLIILISLINIKKSYMKLFLIGVILNFIVIFGNGGKMPVSISGIKGIHQETTLPERTYDIKHVALNKDTRFIYLADIILIPRPYPLPKILSIGDIFIMIGTYMFFQVEMKRE